MGRFKKPVPESRTIVPGHWSDLLDVHLASFDAEGDETEVRVNLKNISELAEVLALALLKTQEQNQSILHELQLLNARFEEMANTGIDSDDVGDQNG